jgi:hypothetical protein
LTTLNNNDAYQRRRRLIFLEPLFQGPGCFSPHLGTQINEMWADQKFIFLFKESETDTYSGEHETAQSWP